MEKDSTGKFHCESGCEEHDHWICHFLYLCKIQEMQNQKFCFARGCIEYHRPAVHRVVRAMAGQLTYKRRYNRGRYIETVDMHMEYNNTPLIWYCERHFKNMKELLALFIPRNIADFAKYAPEAEAIKCFILYVSDWDEDKGDYIERERKDEIMTAIYMYHEKERMEVQSRRGYYLIYTNGK